MGKDRRPRAEDRLAKRVASIEKALEKLVAKVADLAWKVERLNRLATPIPGADGEEGVEPVVYVGGRPVRIRALSPAEWVKAAGEFPDLAVAMIKAAAEKKGGEGEASVEVLEKAVETAKRWITATAVPGQEFDLELLTVPEAEQAILTIARLNGLDAALAQFFRGRGEGDKAGRDRPPVRGTA